MTLRVALVSHTAEPGGAELSMLDLADELRRFEIEPLLIFLGEGPMLDAAYRRGVPTKVVPLNERAAEVRRHAAMAATATATFGVLDCAWRLAAVVRRAGMDVMHTNSLKAHVIGGLAGRLVRMPVLWHLRDIVAPPHMGCSEAAFMRMTSKLATAVVANSEATARAFGQTHGVYEPGIRIAQFADVPPLPYVKPDRLTILSLGRLANWKGQHVLIDAVRLMAPEARPRLVFAGAPLFSQEAYAASLRASARDLECEWLGHTSSVPDALANCHIMVHSSVAPEPFGKVIVEALAAGRPALATRGGGTEEILVAEMAEWLVAPGDPVELAAAISRLGCKWDETRARASAARVAVARFDLPVAARRIRDLYLELATPTARLDDGLGLPRRWPARHSLHERGRANADA